jgi:starch synthase
VSVRKRKVWIFTFEYAGIIKVGGLGEVPANQIKHLGQNFKITVFIPSHGQITNLKKKYEVEKLPFNCVGQINPLSFGLNEPESKYMISFYRIRLEKTNIIILSGENLFTNRILDDPAVYNPDTLSGKILLFSIGMRYYMSYLIDNQREELPDIIHIHDYHAVIPLLSLKQILIKYGLDVHSIITIHLLTWPRYKKEFYFMCGIDQTPIKIALKEGYNLLSFHEIFDICKDSYQAPTVEKIGAVACDMVTTVSQSYLISDIIPNCGNKLIDFKSDFIWDGCDWDYDEIFQQVLNKHGEDITAVLDYPIDKKLTLSDMKHYLLTHKIAHLNKSPLIRSEKILTAINEISNGNQFIKNGNVKAFEETGPLMITTGRISQQKGFETIFEAIPDVIKSIPNARFLFLILPTEYSLTEIKSYAQIVKKYPNNVRIIFGVAKDIFHLAHISADVYCALSRWEPFGIIALEAMATKLPIIATRVGGFQETIVDVRNSSEIGTGLLIEKDNPSEFANALISMFLAAEISKSTRNDHSIYEQEIFKMINHIPDEVIKSLVLLDADLYSKIKENCYNRVEKNFRWSIVTKKLINLYIKLLKMYRF